MCGCQLHHDRTALCTCICREHQDAAKDTRAVVTGRLNQPSPRRLVNPSYIGMGVLVGTMSDRWWSFVLGILVIGLVSIWDSR